MTPRSNPFSLLDSPTPRHPSRWVGFAIALGLLASACEAVAAKEPTASLRDQLTRSISISWQHQSLRAGLSRVAQTQQVSMLLDRRVDPDQPVDLEVTQQPLSEALEQIEARTGLRWEVIGNLVYWGPAEVVEELPLLLEKHATDSRQLAPALRKRLAASLAWQWPDVSTPQTLWEQLAQELGCELAHDEALPHDLWGAQQFPALTWDQRATLLLAQFDCTYKIEPGGTRLSVIPLPKGVPYTRRYTSQDSQQEAIRAAVTATASAELKEADGKLTVTGPAHLHVQIARLLKRSAPRKNAPGTGEQRYTLRLDDVPLKQLVKGLSRKLGQEIALDEAAATAAGIDLDRPVSADVRDQTLEGLLRTVFEPSGLVPRRQGETWQLVPRGQ